MVGASLEPTAYVDATELFVLQLHATNMSSTQYMVAYQRVNSRLNSINDLDESCKEAR